MLLLWIKVLVYGNRIGEVGRELVEKYENKSVILVAKEHTGAKKPSG